MTTVPRYLNLTDGLQTDGRLTAAIARNARSARAEKPRNITNTKCITSSVDFVILNGFHHTSRPKCPTSRLKRLVHIPDQSQVFHNMPLFFLLLISIIYKQFKYCQQILLVTVHVIHKCNYC